MVGGQSKDSASMVTIVGEVKRMVGGGGEFGRLQ